MNTSNKKLFLCKQSLPKLFLVCLATLSLLACNKSPEERQPSALDSKGSKLFAENNLPSETNAITVFYSSSEYMERSVRVRNLIEEAITFYADTLNINYSIDVAILNQSDWDNYVPRGIPWGMPFITGPENHQVAVLPATPDGVVTMSALGMKQYASPATMDRVKYSNKSFEEGAFLFTDAIAIHELGHAFTTAFGIQPASAWNGEFLASYFAYAFFSQKHPELAHIYSTYSYYLNSDAPGPNPDKSLARLEKLYTGVGPDDYVWYQAMFIGLAEELYAEQGLLVLRKMKLHFPKTQSPESVSLDAEFEKLEKISPLIKPWRLKSFN